MNTDNVEDYKKVLLDLFPDIKINCIPSMIVKEESCLLVRLNSKLYTFVYVDDLYCSWTTGWDDLKPKDKLFSNMLYGFRDFIAELHRIS